MSTTEDFEYESLDVTRPTVRVVKIHPGCADSTIKCTLKVIDLEEDSHVCLSYVCGTSENRETILLNGKRFTVLPNLFSFLKKARSMEISDWLWIDAISIHQSDDDERSRQVQQMANIYRLTRQLLIWLGDWPINEAKAFRRQVQLYTGLEARVASAWPVRYALERHWKSAFEYLANMSYFSRTWICQEILLSKKRYVIVGDELIDWSDVATFVARNAVKYNIDRQPKNFNVWRLCNISQMGPDKRFRTSHVLRIVKETECTEQRDRLYAILGLIDQDGAFPVSYEKSLTEIFTDAIEYFCRMFDPGASLIELGQIVRNLGPGWNLRTMNFCEGCSVPENVDNALQCSKNYSDQASFEHPKTYKVAFKLQVVDGATSMFLPKRQTDYAMDGGVSCDSCNKGLWTIFTTPGIIDAERLSINELRISLSLEPWFTGLGGHSAQNHILRRLIKRLRRHPS